MKRNKTTPTSWDLILFIQIREAGGDHVRRDVVTCRQRVTVGPLRLLEKAKNYVAEKVTNMPKPEASVTDVDFKRVSRDSVEYLAKVSVQNPYSTSIPICEIKYSLKSAGREIAAGTIPDPGSLKASDTTMLDVPVKVPHSILLSLAKDIGADWDIDYQLDIGLVIDLPVIGNFTIPLSQKGEIKLPTLTDMFA
ncbi:Desiccation protectant protein Lea14 [Glycine soja]